MEMLQALGMVYIRKRRWVDLGALCIPSTVQGQSTTCQPRGLSSTGWQASTLHSLVLGKSIAGEPLGSGYNQGKMPSIPFQDPVYAGGEAVPEDQSRGPSHHSPGTQANTTLVAVPGKVSLFFYLTLLLALHPHSPALAPGAGFLCWLSLPHPLSHPHSLCLPSSP